jgi:hypothetical protein
MNLDRFKKSRNYAILQGIYYSSTIGYMFLACVIILLSFVVVFTVHIIGRYYYKFIEYLIINKYLPILNPHNACPVCVWMLLSLLIICFIIVFIFLLTIVCIDGYKEIKQSIQNYLDIYDRNQETKGE